MKSNYRTLLTLGFTALVLILASTGLAAIIPVETEYQLVEAILFAEAGDIIELAEGTYDMLNGACFTVPVTMRGATGDPADVRLNLLGLHSGIIADDEFQGDGPVIFEGLLFRNYFVYSLPLLRHDGPIELRNCVFENNRVPNLIIEDGGLVMENCTFLNNEASYLVSGNSDIIMDGCRMQGNTSEFIIWQESGDLAISNSNMVDNTGVCLRTAPNTVSISNSIFTGNSGGLLLHSQAVAVLTGCEILNNSITDGHLESGSTTTFICCELDLSRWTLEGDYVVDNDNCAVSTTLHSFDGLKALYR